MKMTEIIKYKAQALRRVSLICVILLEESLWNVHVLRLREDKITYMFSKLCDGRTIHQ